MGSKPRKQFDGIARPQGFIDDAAKALLKAAGRVKNAGKKGEASLLSPMSRKKFEKIYGETSPKIYGKQPPKIKDLPSIKGKSPRPMPSKPNPKAPTTADVDRILSKAARDWNSAKPKAKPERKMNPYYKTSKKSRNYRG